LTVTTSANGGYRDAGGRFLKGCPGGPGNPFVRQIALLKSALYEALTAEEIAAVVQAMLEKARGGDVAAARLILGYAVGKPVPGSIATILDGELTQQANYDCLSDEELRTLLRITEKVQAHADDGKTAPR
jgi:hypothetical protein